MSRRRRRRLAALLALSLLLCGLIAHAEPDPPPRDPLFDMAAIIADPVDVAVLETEVMADGIVFETIEFTSRVVDGEAERLQGIFAYPQGAKGIPAVFWSQGGMSAADRYFPGLLARKGYACLAITLRHDLRQSFTTPFDAANPTAGNMTLLARDQLRGITVLSQREQVDPDRMAVAGASYGGVFATLIAGVDLRVKAGFSFFGAGNHMLGSNLPQFQTMPGLADAEVWNRTIDPAFRLKSRDIPFMWGVAFNDNWFYYPAVATTYMEALGTDKRMAVLPRWQHGFPPNIDQALVDFLDTTALAPGTRRAAYNAPGPLRLSTVDGQVIASFDWTGENTVTTAEVVVSYGAYSPWLGWPSRAAFILPATIAGRTATAVLPIPSRELPLVAWGSVTDERGVLTSSLPTYLDAAALAPYPVTPELSLNCFIDGTLGPDVVQVYRMMGHPLGTADRDVKHSGEQSIRVDPAGKQAYFRTGFFHHVPGLAHRFSVHVRAATPTELRVRVLPHAPRSWQRPMIRELVAQDAQLAPLLAHWQVVPEPIEAVLTVGPEWQAVTLALPLPTVPVDGYQVEIRETGEPTTAFWLDSIEMKPIWPTTGP